MRPNLNHPRSCSFQRTIDTFVSLPFPPSPPPHPTEQRGQEEGPRDSDAQEGHRGSVAPSPLAFDACVLACPLTASPASFSIAPGLEAEARRLNDQERNGSLPKADRDRLEFLRAEVAHIKKTKDEYLAKHPEHRKFVYPKEEEARLKAEKEKREDEATAGYAGPSGMLRGKDGKLVSL